MQHALRVALPKADSPLQPPHMPATAQPWPLSATSFVLLCSRGTRAASSDNSSGTTRRSGERRARGRESAVPVAEGVEGCGPLVPSWAAAAGGEAGPGPCLEQQQWQAQHVQQEEQEGEDGELFLRLQLLHKLQQRRLSRQPLPDEQAAQATASAVAAAVGRGATPGMAFASLVGGHAAAHAAAAGGGFGAAAAADSETGQIDDDDYSWPDLFNTLRAVRSPCAQAGSGPAGAAASVGVQW